MLRRRRRRRRRRLSSAEIVGVLFGVFLCSSPLLMIRQKEDHLKSESVAHFRLHHPLLSPRLCTHTHSNCAWSHSEATHTCIERGRDRKMGKHKIICLAAFFFFFLSVLSCWRPAMQSPALCRHTLYAGTHTLFLTASAHTHTTKINK